jgi:enamine deaminase RidA (YjgF/YER057c/UK114 family)
VVKFNTYLVGADNIPKFMNARRELFELLYPNGKWPPNTLLVVDRLVEKEFLLEVEAIAASW